jgi:hypothetical protein
MRRKSNIYFETKRKRINKIMQSATPAPKRIHPLAVLGFEVGHCTSIAGTLPLESCPQSFLL